MISRVVELTEETHGTPVYTQTGVDANGMPIYEQTGWKDPWYIPALSQFPSAFQVSYQDGTVYIVYGPAKNRRHWHQLILIRVSPGLYLAAGRQQYVHALGSAPNLNAYANRATHGWRTYHCDGTDSATDPITGAVIGAFANRLVTFTEQPPDKVTGKWPYVVGTMTITDIRPAVPVTCGPVDISEVADKETDESDRQEEIEP